METIVIIADDLTGAADTGVQFRPFFESTILVSYLQLANSRIRDAVLGTPGAKSIYTNSRSLSATGAHDRLRILARQLAEMGSFQVYKKMDSCLRGNPAAEAEALMDALGYEACFIAPAFPEMGRTTVNGTHLIDGIPVSETEISRDPLTPVTESALATLIRSQSRYAVGHIPLEVLEADEAGLQDAIEAQIRGGIRHIVFDAVTQAHLDHIACLVFSSSRSILAVGSAGLAAGLGALLTPRPAMQTDPFCPGHGNHLLVSGTNSQVTRRQIDTLLAAYPYEEIALDAAFVMDECRSEDLLHHTALICSKLSHEHIILTIDSSMPLPPPIGRSGRSQTALAITAGLGRLLAAVLAEIRPDLLFLTGGDTADAVITAAGVGGMKILDEIAAGVVRGALFGGLLDGLPVVTKAGAFGRDDTLVVLHERLQGAR